MIFETNSYRGIILRCSEVRISLLLLLHGTQVPGSCLAHTHLLGKNRLLIYLFYSIFLNLMAVPKIPGAEQGNTSNIVNIWLYICFFK